MTPITLEQIAQAVGGQASAAGAIPPIGAICTDSRRMQPASLFVALHGEKFDGHAFLKQAAAGGAIAALVDGSPPPQTPIPCVRVADTRQALGKLAGWMRGRLRGKVIAVAGSNGKTSTKRLIGAALRPHLKGSISPKSYNNDIGVPLTIFAADADQDYLVLELGTNHHGEMARLAEIARPDVAVITNCSAEHLEGLTDLEGVRRENAAVIVGLPSSGLLVINGDDPQLAAAVGGFSGRQVTFGFASSNDLWASGVSCGANGIRFRLNNGLEIFVPLLGRHTAANALAAIAVARHLQVPDPLWISGLAAASGPEMRLQLTQVGGVSVLNDAYNANPASMQAALQTLRSLPTAGRRIAVLGEMRELGDWTEQLHREIGQAAAHCGPDILVCVGANAAFIAESAGEAGMAVERIHFHRDAAAAAAALAGWLGEGDLVLLKASRAVGLEAVAAAIAQAQFAPRPPAGVRAAG
jgi:UDP-N-acetylmuramoyl-tripeptide--D-alanyl-D-alanine ligase